MKDLTTRRTIQTEDKSIIRFTTVDRLPEDLRERVEISSTTTVKSFHDLIRNEVSSSLNLKNYNEETILITNGIYQSYYNLLDLRLLSINFGIDLSRAIFYMKGNNCPLVTYFKGYYYMIMSIERNIYTMQNTIEMDVI